MVFKAILDDGSSQSVWGFLSLHLGVGKAIQTKLSSLSPVLMPRGSYGPISNMPNTQVGQAKMYNDNLYTSDRERHMVLY